MQGEREVKKCREGLTCAVGLCAGTASDHFTGQFDAGVGVRVRVACC